MLCAFCVYCAPHACVASRRERRNSGAVAVATIPLTLVYNTNTISLICYLSCTLLAVRVHANNIARRVCSPTVSRTLIMNCLRNPTYGNSKRIVQNLPHLTEPPINRRNYRRRNMHSPMAWHKHQMMMMMPSD